VDAVEKIKHFRHFIASECEHEPESQEHLQMKKICFERFVDIYGEGNVELEKRLEGNIADVFVKPNIAIECQVSPLSLDKWMDRTFNYNGNGIYVLWIISFNKTKISGKLLAQLYRIYFGRRYEIDCEKMKVYANHHRLLKEINNFALLCRESTDKHTNLDFKIARFYDKKFW
jgi:competence CoiA-like predicted nuclease